MCLPNGITEVNKTHDVCGFTASLCAYFEKSPTGKKDIEQENNAYDYVVEKIGAFLKQIKESTLWFDIQKFTQSFGGDYSKFDIAAYEKTITRGFLVIQSAKIKGMAMTPHATTFLLSNILGLKSAKLTEGSLDEQTAPGKVVGLSDGNGLHNGLKHWVYVNKAGMVSNYGELKKFEEVKKNPNSLLNVSCYITC